MTTIRQEYEKAAMQIREEKEKALKEDEGDIKKSTNLQAEKDQIRKKKPFPRELIEMKSQVPIGSRRRIRKRRNLTLSERIQVAHKVICRELLQADVAKEYRVTRSCIHHIIKKCKANPKFLKELMEKRESEERDKELIKNSLLELQKSNTFIDSVQLVQKKIQEKKQVTFKKYFIH